MEKGILMNRANTWKIRRVIDEDIIDEWIGSISIHKVWARVVAHVFQETCVREIIRSNYN